MRRNLMSIVKSLVFGVCGILFAGCSSTLVVLVPDPSGKVGEVSVSSGAGEKVLKLAGESTEVSSETKLPSEPKVLSNDEIDDLFEDAIRNEPIPPKRFMLYFEFDSTRILPEAEHQIEEIQDQIKLRQTCEISVIGHTDRAGEAEYNRALSLRRAGAVAKQLRSLGIPKECMDIRYYGESDPLVPTEDGVPEPRNRRVEVEVR